MVIHVRRITIKDAPHLDDRAGARGTSSQKILVQLGGAKMA